MTKWQKVDFNNQMTGNWSFYYTIDDSTVDTALPAAATRARLPHANAFAGPAVRDEQYQNFGPTAVNEARVTFFRTVPTRTTLREVSPAFRPLVS